MLLTSKIDKELCNLGILIPVFRLQDMGQKSSIKLPERGMNVSFNEHKKIFDAILRKDPVKAEENAKKTYAKNKKSSLRIFC